MKLKSPQPPSSPLNEASVMELYIFWYHQSFDRKEWVPKPHKNDNFAEHNPHYQSFKYGSGPFLYTYLILNDNPTYPCNISIFNERISLHFCSLLMLGSCHSDRALIVEIEVEYRKIFVVFFICCEMYFGSPSRYRKGEVISVKLLESNIYFFSIQQKTKKVNKHFKIWRQSQNSMTCQNDIIHT